MKITKCTHSRIHQGDHYGYSASVAVPPYTEENRAAHGGITYTETCLDCGAERRLNSNGGHREYSPWHAQEVITKITLELEPEMAAALKRFAEKVAFTHAMGVLYPHVPRKLRETQAYQVMDAFAALEAALTEAKVRSWPWVETGHIGE